MKNSVKIKQRRNRKHAVRGKPIGHKLSQYEEQSPENSKPDWYKTGKLKISISIKAAGLHECFESQKSY